MKAWRRLVLWLLEIIHRDELKIIALLERLIALLTRRPARLIIEGTKMDVIQGAAFALVVRCLDSEATPVPVDDTNGPITVTATPPDTVATVGAPTAPGVYPITGTAGQTLGPVTLVASDGVLTSAADTSINVVVDPAKKPGSLVIAAS
jgi:hypothetical protein